MTELVKGSTELSNDAAADYAANLLRHYSFDLGDYAVEQLLSYWLEQFDSNWIRLAVIEALYQGRYKAISVEQILAFWQRRGQPSYHFNHEFERLVCDRFPRNLSPSPVTASTNGSKRPTRPELPPAPVSHQLYYLKNQLASVPDSQTAIAENGLSQASTPPDGDATSPTPAPVSSETEVAAQQQQPPSSVDHLADTPLGRALLLLPDVPPSDHPPPPSVTEAETTLNSLLDVEVVAIANLLLLSLSSLTQPLKPKIQLYLTTLYQPSWLVPLDNQHRIHQFIPVADVSEFHSKLKAVAQPESFGPSTASDKLLEPTDCSCLLPELEVAPKQASTTKQKF